MKSSDDGNWYWLDTSWGCGGVRIKDDKIVETAPIFRKMLGKSLGEILNWGPVALKLGKPPQPKKGTK